MTRIQLSNPREYLASRGGLHDTSILAVNFDIQEKVVEIQVDDLNANFSDVPDGENIQPGTLVFQGITAFVLDVETFEGIRIAEALAVQVGSQWRIEVDLNLGGGELTRGAKSIRATFDAMCIETEK